MFITKCITLLMCLCIVTSIPNKESKKQKITNLDYVKESRLDRPQNITEQQQQQQQTNSTIKMTTTQSTAKTENTTDRGTTTITSSQKNSSNIAPNNSIKVSRIYDYAILSWMKDSYVMSFVIPIAAGIGSAIVLLIIVNLGRCVRNRCQRRRRKKFSNESIRKMNLADRMKLLAETSDEEF
ncbi:uncharacterized protein LOC111619171 [Centruroides sculpturatus]|uniref:uncharacterized protein LOC111619171 n=1 Tax=Centruroides sculpturatus TaxID=218467 RepID=UPI000C6E6237|nr:uncharacterized protein LOC111619171 [Centruroides sculpturatus]XP_023216639.1 uncharacterized protein LOC111619171 [Centruroides sculpturatus]